MEKEQIMQEKVTETIRDMAGSFNVKSAWENMFHENFPEILRIVGQCGIDAGEKGVRYGNQFLKIC